jgi:hypothetical protein
MPLGYTYQAVLDEHGHPKYDKGKLVTERVVDRIGRITVERIYDLIAAGHTPGSVARILNGEGRLTTRGGTWVARQVRHLASNDDYAGRNGYPAIIDSDRWKAIHSQIKRMDPAAVQKRKGGREPESADYLLKGVAFCRACGAALYTRRQAVGRVYVCAHRRQGTGVCHASVIPAELAEMHVLSHLHCFIGSVEEWIATKLNERTDEQQMREAAIDRERAVLADIDQRRDRHFAEYRTMVEKGDRLARYALEEVERIDQQRAAQEKAIAEAEAIVSEWAGPSDIDAALDYYATVVDLVNGRIAKARGAVEINRALHDVIAGIWFEMDGDRLHAEFELRHTGLPADRRVGVHLFQHAQPVGLEARRITLPQTGTHTFVYDHPVMAPMSL